jgi:multiple sugar transport system ATP-binding protein
MADVSYVKATCLYPGNPDPAVDALDLEVEDGEFMVLVGPSGSGKSTIRHFATERTPHSGQCQ